ncbi:hypothetical protein ABFV05_015601 [Capra hircus]
MGLIKDRNGTDQTEAEDIKKRCQEYTEELYKKYLHDKDNHEGIQPRSPAYPNTEKKQCPYVLHINTSHLGKAF